MRAKTMTEEQSNTENNGAEQQPERAGAAPTEARRRRSAGQRQSTNPNMKWYIIHTYSGFERKVKESLESRMRAFGAAEHRSAGS